MKQGDQAVLTYLAERFPVMLDQVESYNKAFIIAYTFVKSRSGAITCVFPDYPYLPPVTTNPTFYSPPPCWIEWENHLWVVPMGVRQSKAGIRTHLIVGDPVVHAKHKIDYIHWLVNWYGMTEDMLIVPGTDKERRLHKKWWQDF